MFNTADYSMSYMKATPRVLYFNTMLPFLARLLAHRAVRKYETINDVLKNVPKEGEIMVLKWKDTLLKTSFFVS